MKRNLKKVVFICLILLIVVIGGLSINKFNRLSPSEEIRQTYEEIAEENKITPTPEITPSNVTVEPEVDVITKYQQAFNNSDIIAELTFVNTDITVPVVKTIDNDFYLDHLLDKRQNALGSVFMDYRNNTIDRKLLIYGHNSQTVDTEFHIIESYLKPEFLKSHKTITLRTKDEVYNYQIFAIVIVTTDYQHMKLNFTSEEYKTHLEWLKNNSTYDTGVPINGNEEILILQTCYYYPKDSYLLLVGKKI